MPTLRNCFLMCLAFISQITFGQDIIKENLGPNINTRYDETKPLISPDGKIFYFARQNYPENYKGDKDLQDIYYSLSANENWSKAVNIGVPLNDKHPNGVSAVAPDGNKLLVINAYHPTGLTMGGASISIKEDNHWKKPERINIENFYNFSEYVDYYLSNDERSLLMAVEREGSQGDQDLYVSFRKDEYNWTEPVSLGPIVNTPQAEFSPFLAADNKTLFFASEGHKGFGKSDIFYSKRLDNTWTNWSEPENIGPEVNSEGFEGYYTIPASSDYAYFVSDNGSIDGSKDLFRVTLPYKFRPEPVLLVNGHVLDQENKEPVAASIIFLDVKTGEEAGFALSNFNDGSYKIILSKGTAYEFFAERPGYIGVVQYRDLTTIDEYEEQESNLVLVPLKKGQSVTTHHIFFKENSDQFEEDAIPELDRFVSILKNNPEIKVEIGSHVNIHTSATENLGLSENRAKAIKSYFKKHGIHPLRLLSLGYGSVKPFEGPAISLKEGTNINNRIEFTILQTDWFPPSLNEQDENISTDVNGDRPEEATDKDNDGIIDLKDDCPNVAGIKENNGCPELTKEVKKILKEALDGIEFESNQDIIKPKSYTILDNIVSIMQENPEYKLQISGHTDNQGQGEFNLQLSQKRAQSVRDYLIEKDIEAHRLEAIGHGATKPIDDNNTADGRKKNRRVEFTIIFE